MAETQALFVRNIPKKTARVFKARCATSGTTLTDCLHGFMVAVNSGALRIEELPRGGVKIVPGRAK
jgi:hypothetical protein